MNKDEFLEELKRIYTVVETLSSKSGKNVLHCRHNEIGRDITVRLTSEDMPVCRFLRTVRHVNLPEVYDIYNLDDGFAEIEEYIDGINICDVIKAGLYDYDGACRVMRQLCSALSVLHKNGFVHLDVKPENVILADNNVVKLIDFDSCIDFYSKESNKSIHGTIGYAPPELYDSAQIDCRSDIYSAGVLFNVMLTGCHPSEKLASGKAGRIITKCIQIEPEQRYPSVKSLLKAL